MLHSRLILSYLGILAKKIFNSEILRVLLQSKNTTISSSLATQYNKLLWPKSKGTIPDLPLKNVIVQMT